MITVSELRHGDDLPQAILQAAKQTEPPYRDLIRRRFPAIPDSRFDQAVNDLATQQLITKASNAMGELLYPLRQE